jgi:hypothetical protein
MMLTLMIDLIKVSNMLLALHMVRGRASLHHHRTPNWGIRHSLRSRNVLGVREVNPAVPNITRLYVYAILVVDWKRNHRRMRKASLLLAVPRDLPYNKGVVLVDRGDAPKHRAIAIIVIIIHLDGYIVGMKLSSQNRGEIPCIT